MNKKLRYLVIGLLIFCGIIFSNLFLQWCQNDLSADLAIKFAFSWHTAKFFLASLVLLVLFLFLASLAGSLIVGASLYSLFIAVIGFATYMKMSFRQEPVYPDDLTMITQLGFFKEVLGTGLFLFIHILMIGVIGLFIYQLFRSFFLSKNKQILRVITLCLSSLGLVYISHFNDETNLLRRAYNQSALWIPYSQEMNYYNTGFVGGFLYNLRVDAMEEPTGYSKEAIEDITEKYQQEVEPATTEEEQPNIVYVMSESFSNPEHLQGLSVSGNPLKEYYEVAEQAYSGKMLSQNYGGGTANIEFEALTSFSMGLLNPQMTSPYTMLVPKMDTLPSLVSLSEARGYDTTAIHPYDTSMYKRQDVYSTLGFDQFIDQDSIDYTQTIENNPYISDEAAYQQVLDQLKEEQSPQFVHLVTMQTHMPYDGKYEDPDYQVSGPAENIRNIEGYLQDINYSSQALQDFTEELAELPERTLVVFWGDHLPGIYSDQLQEQNTTADLHQTEFLMVDSEDELTHEEEEVTSPFYFAPNLFERAGLQSTPFYELLSDLEKIVSAFEPRMYVDNDGQWHEELTLNQNQQEIYNDYRLIQYDILQGEQYSLENDFFE
ncbi:MAG: LTA synthase family protein [Tetragenococcus sp.]|nr:LTA synthase family protein [Tetragenococcus sp.]